MMPSARIALQLFWVALIAASLAAPAARAAGPDDPAFDRAYRAYQAGAELDRRGDCAGALTQYRAALALLDKANVATSDPHRQSVLLNLAFCEHKTGAERAAYDHLKAILPDLDRAPRTVVPANQLILAHDLMAKITHQLGLWNEEIAALQQAASIFAIAPGQDPLDLIDIELRRSVALMRAGQVEAGRGLRREVLARVEASAALAGAVQGVLNTLGNNLANAGLAEDAVGVFDDLIGRLGSQPSMQLGVTYFNKGVALRGLARWNDAIDAYQRSVDILEQVNGPNDGRTLEAIGGLGQVYDYAGRLAQAQQWLSVAHDRAKTQGRDPSLVALFANNLANVYRETGDVRQAEALDREGLAIRQPRFGEDSFDTQASRRNLAIDLQMLGRYADAAAMLQPLLDRLAASLGPDHPATWDIRRTIASLELSAGNLDAAERRYAVIQQQGGLDRLSGGDRAATLNALATLADRRGRTAEARSLHERSYAEARAALGPDHFDTLIYFSNALSSRIDTADARTVADIADLNDRVAGWAGREVAATDDPTMREKLLTLFRTTRQLVVDAAIRNPSPDSLALLINAMERWKGIGLREDRLLAELTEADDAETARLARALVAAARNSAPGQAAELARTRAALIERSPAYAEYRRRGDVRADDIVHALGAGEHLLDYWVIPAGGKDREADRVIAVLIGPQGIRRVRDLGKIGPLAFVSGVYGFLTDPRVSPLIYAQFVQPFEPDLAGVDTLYIAPDGPLFLVPFEALRTPRGHYLVEERAIDMVRDGRGLVAARRGGATTRSGIVVADDIDYGKAPRGPLLFRPLGGIKTQAILPVLQGSAFAPVQFVRGTAATKSWLVGVAPPPRILHLSTHGFYWSGPADRVDPLRLGLIALAGANTDFGRGNSGILTAAEAMRLHLAGTDLVVLSACNSAQGEATYADGLAGLSSALAIAGARRSLLALWPVSNAGTAAFMRRFYEHLVEQPDRYAVALRATKLDAIRGALPSPPGGQDWKAFVLVTN